MTPALFVPARQGGRYIPWTPRTLWPPVADPCLTGHPWAKIGFLWPPTQGMGTPLPGMPFFPAPFPGPTQH